MTINEYQLLNEGGIIEWNDEIYQIESKCSTKIVQYGFQILYTEGCYIVISHSDCNIPDL